MVLRATLVTVGNLPKGPYTALAERIKKPLPQFVRLEHRVLSDTDKLIERLPSYRAPLIILDAGGRQLTSEAFSKACLDWEESGDVVTFVLGGAKGLPTEVKQAATWCLSLSNMTTTHDLAHLFFLEQLYRAMTIAHGKPYHY